MRRPPLLAPLLAGVACVAFASPANASPDAVSCYEIYAAAIQPSPLATLCNPLTP